MEVTNSSIQTYQTCQRKYHYAYNLLLKPKIENKNFLVGTKIHKQLENYYADGSLALKVPENKEEAIISGALNAYSKKYSRDEFKNYIGERVFTIEIPGTPVAVKGRKDAIVTLNEETVLLEYKTTSKDLEAFKEQVDLDPQPLMYAWAHFMEHHEVLNGVLYRVVRKPLIRLKKDETEDQFYQRIIAEYETNPDKYLYTFKKYITLDELKLFQGEIAVLIAQMEQIRAIWPRNMASCFNYNSMCPYYPLCQKRDLDEGTVKSLYTKKTQMHEELKEEEENV